MKIFIEIILMLKNKYNIDLEEMLAILNDKANRGVI
jgi:hypothetical protein